MTLDIPEQLAERLKAFAEAQNRPIPEVIEMWLNAAQPTRPQEDEEGLPPRGTAARGAYEARRSTFDSGKTDTAALSREILENEFADYILRRRDADK